MKSTILIYIFIIKMGFIQKPITNDKYANTGVKREYFTRGNPITPLGGEWVYPCAKPTINVLKSTTTAHRES